MKKLAILLLLMQVFVVSAVFAGGKGTATAQFLKLGLGARAASMGGAYTGVSDEVNAIYWNPAGLTQVNNKQLTAMHALWFEDISFDYLAYCQKGLGGAFGIGLNYLNSGDIDKYDFNGNALGETYNATDMNVSLSYAKKVKKVSLGLNLKYISMSIEEESATAYALDAGTFFNPWDKLGFGIVAQNIGSSVKFISESESLPFIAKLGCSYKVKENFLLALDAVSPSDDDLGACVGADYKFRLKPGDFSLRAGYKTSTASGFDSLAGVTAGFGLDFSGYGLDYAWDTYGDLGYTHIISLMFKFGQVAGEGISSKAKKAKRVKKKKVRREKTLNVAVIDFQALAPISMSEATFTTEIFRSSLVRTKAYTIVDRNNMEKVLAEQGFQQTGCTTTECAVQMGKLLNVNGIITGTFGKLGAHYLLTINAVDIETSEIIHSDKASCTELTPDEVQRMTDKLVDKLIDEVR
ncbi:MAG: PorV/PorQ family protein [Endomicrobiales bacterium]|nr:PorV/PorQ family protein [Endomicrobiales bacterium]